jgi:hypothetical protein
MATINKQILSLQVALILLCSAKINAQDFNKINKSDVVYIYFKETIYKQLFLEQPNGKGDFYYVFDKYYQNRHIILYQKGNFFEEKK